MRFVVNCVLLVGFNDKIHHGFGFKIRFSSNFLLSFWWMQMCLATLRPLNFFKRKKEKKESHSSSGGFQKSKFFKKNTTWYIIGNRGFKIKVECFAKRYRWRFFLKPAGLELAFLNTWNLSLLSFFYFLFWIFKSNVLVQSDFIWSNESWFER